MLPLLVAAVLPAVYWDRDPEPLKRAGIERMYRPGDELPRVEKVPPPRVQYRMDVASATRIPWIDSNGWRFARNPGRVYWYDAPARSGALAAAEAFSYGVDAIIHLDASDAEPFARMIAFLKRIDAPALPPMADVAVLDDGSSAAGEILNLLSRHNLLFTSAPDSKCAVTIDLRQNRQDPIRVVRDARAQVTDSKRLLRLFGSDVVLGHVNGDGRRMRVHLLNYSGRKIAGLRVRVHGEWRDPRPALFGAENNLLPDFSHQDGGTEFTIPEINTSAVIDLSAE